MRYMFLDVALFGCDPLSFLVERGDPPLEPLALSVRPVYPVAGLEYVKPPLKMSEDLVDKGPIGKVRVATGDNIVKFTGKEHRRAP